MGTNGMVSSGHPLASLAGLDILQEGGNVVEPYMCGVGGTGLALLYVAGAGRPIALNFTGRAPGSADRSLFTDENRDLGAMATLAPGCVAGWLAMHERYGSVDRERLFGPAIEYASSGFPITYQNSHLIAQYAGRLRPFPYSARIMLDSTGKAPRPGSRLGMTDLAGSLGKVATHGRDIFYTGELAESIVKVNSAAGGLLTMDDLADYEVEWAEPISVNYHGSEIYTTPPSSYGFQTLQTMKAIESSDGPGLSSRDAESLHYVIEAMKPCIEDRITYAGDPNHVEVPVDGLLSDEHVEDLRRRIGPDEVAAVSGEHQVAGVSVDRGPQGRPAAGTTTHLTTADRDGNVVSMTQTLGNFFGSGVVADDTGIFLNNMSYFFDLDGDSPNVIGPGKRIANPMAPAMAFRDGDFFLSMGTPGGWAIPQTTAQLLMNVLDYGMNVQEAIEAPMFRIYVGRNVHMEERFALELRRHLEARGHEVTVLEPWSMRVGGAHVMEFDREQGIFHGGADPRRDGAAIGW